MFKKTVKQYTKLDAITLVGSWDKAKGCDALFAVLEVIVRGKLRTLKCIYRSTAPQAPGPVAFNSGPSDFLVANNPGPQCPLLQVRASTIASRYR